MTAVLQFLITQYTGIKVQTTIFTNSFNYQQETYYPILRRQTSSQVVITSFR